ncbi:hypothetical protein ACBJ59_28835 [Nonomuraea sp. MTCD27]|uniref:hypothetical protein n=1 Tax=Nonomuraea sp. MTCD27 TaxID=1676747 RepID=UPI0035C1F5FC
MRSSLSRRSRFLASSSYALRADADLELAVYLVFGGMWYRLLNRHAEVNAELAEEIAGLLARIR